MSKVMPFIILALALALIFSGCASSSSPALDSSPSPLFEPSEDSTPKPSEDPTPEPSAEETLPPKASETPPAVNAEESIWGELIGDQYINKAFGFTATIPEGWVLASKEDIALYSGMAVDLIETVTDFDPNAAVTLMICSELPFGSATDFNPNINIAYAAQQDMRLFTDAALFNKLLDDLQEIYTNAFEPIYPNPSVSVGGEQSFKLNGREYVLINTTTEFDGGTMYQEQYSTKVGDGMLTFVAAYYDTADKAMTDVFIQSLMFE